MCKSVLCCCGDELRRSSATVSPELLKRDSDVIIMHLKFKEFIKIPAVIEILIV